MEKPCSVLKRAKLWTSGTFVIIVTNWLFPMFAPISEITHIFHTYTRYPLLLNPLSTFSYSLMVFSCYVTPSHTPDIHHHPHLLSFISFSSLPSFHPLSNPLPIAKIYLAHFPIAFLCKLHFLFLSQMHVWPPSHTHTIHAHNSFIILLKFSHKLHIIMHRSGQPSHTHLLYPAMPIFHLNPFFIHARVIPTFKLITFHAHTHHLSSVLYPINSISSFILIKPISLSTPRHLPILFQVPFTFIPLTFAWPCMVMLFSMLLGSHASTPITLPFSIHH